MKETLRAGTIAGAGVAPLATGDTNTNQVVNGSQSVIVAVSPCADPDGLSGHSALMSSVSYSSSQDALVCGTNAFANNAITSASSGTQNNASNAAGG